MLTKQELCERIIAENYVEDMSQKSYDRILGFWLQKSDKYILEKLAAIGLHFEKYCNLFIIKN